MSQGEVRPPAAVARRVEREVTRLIGIASEGPAEAAYVVVLLKAAAQEAEHRRQQMATLPVPEQEIWESVGASFGDEGAVARARMRTIAEFSDLVDRSIRGDADLAALLGVDRSRISQRVAERSIYAFQTEGEERCYPSWQLINHKPLRGLRKVLPCLDPGLHPLTVDHWFRTPNVDLVVNEEPVSPVEWLATGGNPDVLVGLVPDA